MTFLNPAILFGLIAAVIPILLHFFNLRKLQIIDFSTLAFLKELQKTRIRRLKLTQLLLLLLRIAIVVCAVLAFARPTVPTSFPGLGAKAKSSVVIVLDNSFSMELADERGVRLKQAKEAALRIIRSLSEGDEAALVQMANLDDRRYLEFTRDFGALGEAVQNVPVAYTTGKLESALRLASSVLGKAQNINQEIFIITDNQTNIITDDPGAQRDSAKIFPPSAALFVVPIGADSKAGEKNLSVDSLHLITRIFESGKPVEVEARVRNSGKEDLKDVIVSFVMNGERVAQRTVNIPAGETRTVPIAAAAPEASNDKVASGLVRCMVEVEGDVLEADNRRHFGFVLPPKPRIAIIGTNEETTFLALALRSGNITSSLSVLPPEALSAMALNEVDAVMLVNVPRFSASDVSRLQTFVQDGGGLFIFAGDRSDVANYNSTLLSALKFGTIAQSDYATSAGSPDAEFTAVEKAHPLFSGVFKGENADSKRLVESPRFLKALPLQRNGMTAQALIELPDGAFLAESKLGNGKALYAAAPPFTGWSNFPVTGIFVPIIFRASAYLTASVSASSDAVVGQSVTILLSGKLPKGAPLTITDPANAVSVRQPAQMPSGTVLSLEGGVQQPGVYAISAETSGKQGAIVHTLAVNPPASESVMTTFSGDEMTKALSGFVPDNDQIRIISDYRKASMDTLRASTGTELWRVFLLCAVIAAVAEMLIARRAAGKQS
jgi:hypothetical protein